ncbi:membrane protein insertion efficiency factor YidD [Jonesia quinghaiensis]|uniref:membrane protein insertion efficiency factor YidD n=1 Tax=Jonesia quinghaiensis TaxID=262806 RepID=UPI000A03B344|nr:membrane protein insertion efficiency factor YidD [Jonesia quinghaiensis]
MTTWTKVPRRSLLAVIGFYQRYISILTGPTCRYHPSCSSYAKTAIEVHGAGRGTVLAAWRLMRCVPWTPGGIDDVPPARTEQQQAPRDNA